MKKLPFFRFLASAFAVLSANDMIGLKLDEGISHVISVRLLIIPYMNTIIMIELNFSSPACCLYTIPANYGLGLLLIFY